jgi:hypothetical protein
MAEGLNQREARTPQDMHRQYEGIRFEAQATAYHMAQCWRRPVRHNREIERAALWNALQLEMLCRDVVSGELPPPDGATVGSRYEIQAAARTIIAVLPFTDEERDRLHQQRIPSNLMFEDTSNLAHPELFERWHQWLWLDDHGATQSDVEALGASAMLAEGSGRLGDALSGVLDHPVE